MRAWDAVKLGVILWLVNLTLTMAWSHLLQVVGVSVVSIARSGQ